MKGTAMKGIAAKGIAMKALHALDIVFFLTWHLIEK
jgi:hypothetical protein